MNQKPTIQNQSGTAPNEGLVDQAKHTADKVAQQAKDRVESTISAQKDRAVDAIGGVAEALRSTGESMDQGPIPDLANKAADAVERVSGYLRSRSLGDLVHEVESYARREPAMFLGAAVAIGLLGGRFLKSSADSSSSAQQRLQFQSPGYRYGGSYESYARSSEDPSSSVDTLDDDGSRFGSGR